MTKEEIKNEAEGMVDFYQDEFDLEREDAIDTAMYNFVELYAREVISKEDLLAFADYFGYKIDEDALNQFKNERKDY